MPRINSSGWKSGDVKIHSGTLEDIPNGWELAQDMVDRAVVGAGNLYSKGQQFGADSRTPVVDDHTLSTDQLPSHRHPNADNNTRTPSEGAWSHRSSGGGNNKYSGYEGASLPHKHGVQPVDTRQQSIAVIWIRKL